MGGSRPYRAACPVFRCAGAERARHRIVRLRRGVRRTPGVGLWRMAWGRISSGRADDGGARLARGDARAASVRIRGMSAAVAADVAFQIARPRSEEHTSELQSLMSGSYDVFSLNTKQQII